MITSFFIAVGFLIVVSVICSVAAAFFAHGYIWEALPEEVASTYSGILGGMACAVLVFVLFWSLNPDPPRDNGGRPTVAATATMTTFSGLIWLPLYIYAFAGIRRRRDR